VFEGCWTKSGKAPVSLRWFDTDKGDADKGYDVRSRLVARDFRGNDKHRDDLFAETPPLESLRVLMSRAACRGCRGLRKLLFIDVRKAHLNPRCEQEVYIELPEECGRGPEVCGKLNYWLYGFRPAASAWEAHYSGMLESEGFVRGLSCGVVISMNRQ
jgi:hypothetical protein